MTVLQLKITALALTCLALIQIGAGHRMQAGEGIEHTTSIACTKAPCADQEADSSAFTSITQRATHKPTCGPMQAGEGIEHTKSMPSAEATALVEGRRTADTLPPHWRRSAADPVRPDTWLVHVCNLA